MEELTKYGTTWGSWFQKVSTDFREWIVQKFREFLEKVKKFSRISLEFPQNCLLGMFNHYTNLFLICSGLVQMYASSIGHQCKRYSIIFLGRMSNILRSDEQYFLGRMSNIFKSDEQYF